VNLTGHRRAASSTGGVNKDAKIGIVSHPSTIYRSYGAGRAHRVHGEGRDIEMTDVSKAMLFMQPRGEVSLLELP